MSGDEPTTPYQELVRAWVDLLGAIGSITTRLPPSEDARTAETRPPGGESAPDLVRLIGEISLLLVASGARYWLGAVEAWAKLRPAIDRDLGASHEDPARAAAARGALIDELRASLRSLTDLAYQESRRAQEEFDSLAQRLAPDPRPEASGEHWRRWTTKP